MNLNLPLVPIVPESGSAEVTLRAGVGPADVDTRVKNLDLVVQFRHGLKADRCRSCDGSLSEAPRRTGHKRFEYDIINVETLNIFEEAAVVNPETLREAGLIKRKNALIKILGDGELEKQLKVQAHRFSKSAVQKIESKGGTTEVLQMSANTSNPA